MIVNVDNLMDYLSTVYSLVLCLVPVLGKHEDDFQELLDISITK